MLHRCDENRCYWRLPLFSCFRQLLESPRRLPITFPWVWQFQGSVFHWEERLFIILFPQWLMFHPHNPCITMQPRHRRRDFRPSTTRFPRLWRAMYPLPDSDAGFRRKTECKGYSIFG